MKWCTDWKMYEREKGKTCTQKDLNDDLYYGKLSRAEYDVLSLQIPKPPKKIRKVKGKQLHPCSAKRRKEIRDAEKRQESRIKRSSYKEWRKTHTKRNEPLRRSDNVSPGHR